MSGVADGDFEVTQSTHGSTTVVHVTGEVDWATAPEIEQVLADVVGESQGGVVADYTKVTFLDSTGLSTLLKVRNRLASAERPFAVCACEWPVRNTFEVSGVAGTLRLHQSLDSALAALA